MKKELPIPIFVFGITVRSGTNYMGSLMSKVKEVTSVPKTISQGEFPLFRSKVMDHWDSWFQQLNHLSFGVDDIPAEKLEEKIGRSLLEYYVDRYAIDTPYIFLKDPNVIGIGRVWDFFPDAKVILLRRNGKDLVSSFAKGSQLMRRSYPRMKKIKARIKNWSGYGFVSACRTYKKAAESFQETLQDPRIQRRIGSDVRLLTYEDVFRNPSENLGRILIDFGVNVSKEEMKEWENAEVVGSSFGSKNGKVQDWGRSEVNENFNPVGRYEGWNALQRAMYQRICGRIEGSLKMATNGQ